MMDFAQWQLAALVFTALIFIWQALVYKHTQWLLLSIAVWFALGLFSARIMPNILGITRLPNAFLLYTYLFLGSGFFWLKDVKKMPPQPQSRHRYWRSRSGSILLTLFATATLVIHLAFIVFTLLVAWSYPEGVSPYLAAFLLQLYATLPLNLLALHAFVMLLFYLHRRLARQPADMFSLVQLELGFLISILWLIAAVYGQLSQLFHR